MKSFVIVNLRGVYIYGYIYLMWLFKLKPNPKMLVTLNHYSPNFGPMCVHVSFKGGLQSVM